MSEERTYRGISRRSFLKTGAAVAGAAAVGVELTTLADKAHAVDIPDHVAICGCTGNCSGFCSMEVTVREGKMVDISRQHFPDERHERVCSRGYTHLERVYSPMRIKYPMRRVAGTQRGTDEFEKISWDEAFDEIASKWKSYESQYGPNANIICWGTGSLNGDGSNVWCNRMANILGYPQLSTQFDSNGLTAFPRTFGYTTAALGNDSRMVPEAKRIFVWGANPTESCPPTWYWDILAIENGARMTVIDPIYTIAASKAHDYVPIQGGTDALLAIGMMKTAVAEGLTDYATMVRLSVAPYLVNVDTYRYLRYSDMGVVPAGDPTDLILVTDGAGNFASPYEIFTPAITGEYEVPGLGTYKPAYQLLVERLDEYDMNFIAQTTTIPVEKIVSLTHDWCDGPTTLHSGYGPDHWANGQTYYYCVGALMIITGMIGKPGTGYVGSGMAINYANGGDISKFSTVPGKGTWTIPEPRAAIAFETHKWGNIDMPLKSMFIMGCGVIGNFPDRQRWLKIIMDLDYVVCADVYMCETALYSDLVLPVPHYWEHDFYINGGGPYLRTSAAATPPQFDCKTDMEICFELEKRMGSTLGSEYYPTVEQLCQEAFNNDTARALGLSWDRLKSEKFIESDQSAYGYVGSFGFMLATATSRAQFFQEALVPDHPYVENWDVKRESLPYWEPPVEAWKDNALFSKYPIAFISERSKFKCHSQYTFNPTLLEIDPEPSVNINPDDAAARGIKEGDYIKIFNDRGFVVLKSHLHAGIRPGMAQMDHGWQRDQFVAGHYADLSPSHSNMGITAPSWFDALAQYEKWEG